MAARGGFWKLVVIVMALEAFACLKLALTLPTGLAEQRGDFFFGFIVAVALITPAPPLAGGDSPMSWTYELEFSLSEGGSHPSTTWNSCNKNQIKLE